MADLFRAEFFKLRKSLGFRICLIVFLAKDILYILLIQLLSSLLPMELGGFSQFSSITSSFSSSTTAGMLFGFLASSLITSDYKSRDMQCAIAQGHGRAGILAVKTVVYSAGLWILALEDIIVYTLGSTLVEGFGVKLTGDRLLYMLRVIVCEGFVITMMYMTCVLFAFLFTSKAASVSVNLLALFAIDLGVPMIPYVVRYDTVEKLLEYLPYISVREMAEVDIDWGHAGISLLVALVYGAAMLAGTWLIFRKRDLR